MTKNDTTIGTLIRSAARELEASPTPMLDARVLYMHVAKVAPIDLITDENRPVASGVRDVFLAAVARRRDGAPIAQITGRQEFFGRLFEVSEDVLIPRPETEMLVEAGIAASPQRVLDLGTGSGCLLASILAECPDAMGEGWDISPAALAVARRNLVALHVEHRAVLRERSFANSTDMKFDLIVSNPPYIETDAVLPSSVVDHEPSLALFAGADGLDAYRVIAPVVAQMLTEEGTGILEIGAEQGAAVTALMAATMPTRPIRIERDLAGLDRMVVIGPEVAA